MFSLQFIKWKQQQLSHFMKLRRKLPYCEVGYENYEKSLNECVWNLLYHKNNTHGIQMCFMFVKFLIFWVASIFC